MSKITNVLDYEFTSSKRWSERDKRSPYFQNLKEKIRNFLVKLSGDDILKMLSDILNDNEKDNLRIEHIEALKGISEAVNATKAINKHSYKRPIHLSGLSLSEAKSLGFSISKDLWKSCLNPEDRKLGGRKGISEDLINTVNRHMGTISYPASSRMVTFRTYNKRNPRVLFKKKTISKTRIPVRYRETTLLSAYKKFTAENVDVNLSFSAYRKNLSIEIKKPFSKTDMCHYCSKIGLDIEKELRNLIGKMEDFEMQFNKENARNFLNDKLGQMNIEDEERRKLEEGILKCDDLDLIDFHKEIAKRQRLAYNKYREDPKELKDKIMIDVDYKAKILLGKFNPKKLNGEHFERGKKKVSCLGFGVYYVNEFTNKIQCLNIDIISDHEGSTAGDLKRCFKFLMKLDIFKKIQKKNWIIWSDCGTQFRCAEFNYFLFNELADQGISVSMNWFAEKHGKNMRDQHFSVISNILKSAAQEKKAVCKNAQELVNRLNRHYSERNELFEFSEYEEDEDEEQEHILEYSEAFYFNPPKEEIVDSGTREVKYITYYYNFLNEERNGKFEFFTTIFSDLKTLIPVDSTVDGPLKFKLSVKLNAAENQIVELSNEESRETIQENIGKKRSFILHLQKKFQSKRKRTRIIFSAIEK